MCALRLGARRLRHWAVALLGAAAVVSVALVGAARSATHSSGEIAFGRPNGIYLMRQDGSGLRVLRWGVVAVGLAWSPDGTRIAFSGGTPGGDDSGIMVMDGDGSGLVRLVAGRGLSRPTWSPDGGRIAFSGRPAAKARDGIWVMNAAGGDLRRISTPRLDRMTYGGWGPFDVDWSSAGRLVFTAAERPNRCGIDIYVMNVDGSKLRDVTPAVPRRCPSGEPHDPNPDWSPDGRRIAYARDHELWMMSAEGRSPVRLTHTTSLEVGPDWSPDGRRIAFSRLGKKGEEILLMDADGTGTKRLTGGGGPRWRPVAAR